MHNEDTSHEAKTGGVPNRGSLYAVAAAYSKEAIDTLLDLMMNSKNDGIRLGAAKAIINKALPDLKQSDGAEYMPLPTHTISPEYAKHLVEKGYMDEAGRIRTVSEYMDFKNNSNQQENNFEINTKK